MRFVAIAFVLCAPLAARAADVQALETLEAANQREVTPQRLMAIAQCHRELAYARLHEAALASEVHSLQTGSNLLLGGGLLLGVVAAGLLTVQF